MDLAQQTANFVEALLSLDRLQATEIARAICPDASGLSALDAMVVDSLKRIGDGWDDGTCSLAQIYMSGVICQEVLNELLQGIERHRSVFPRMGIGVLLDHHAMGKNMVLSVVRAAGGEILDFGCGLDVASMVALALEEKVEILLVSTLMLPSALHVRELRDMLDRSGRQIRLIVGGAPFRMDPDLWRRVGADADGGNAAGVIGILERLCGVAS